MTTQEPVPPSSDVADPVQPEFGWLALVTADALEAVIEAVLAGDPTAARRVLRGSSARGTARALAESAARIGVQVAHPAASRRTACTLQLISDLGRVSTLVDVLAKQVLHGDLSAAAREVVEPDLRIVGVCGAERLRRLATGLPLPEMDAPYLRCGCELRSALDRLSGGTGRASEPRPALMSPVAAGAAVVESILLASRHAARAA